MAVLAFHVDFLLSVYLLPTSDELKLLLIGKGTIAWCFLCK